MGDAEILAAALVAARCFGGNPARAQAFLSEQRCFARRLSPGRFIRRLRRCAHLLEPLAEVLAGLGREMNPGNLRILDSFPAAACDNYRIRRCRRYQGEAWRG